MCVCVCVCIYLLFIQPEGTVVPAHLLKARPNVPIPDLSPFLLRQQVKEHINDVFEDYDNLLLETALRIPYQMKKLADSKLQLHVTFDAKLQHLLAEVNKNIIF